MQDNLAEQAIAEQVEHAHTHLRDTGQLSAQIADQEAAQMRSAIRAALGERPITDDLLLGMSLGVWALRGAFTSVIDEVGSAEVAVELLPHVETMQICWINLIRQGVAAEQFDFDRAFNTPALKLTPAYTDDTAAAA